MATFGTDSGGFGGLVKTVNVDFVRNYPQGSSAAGIVNTIYTVPAGSVAIVFINRVVLQSSGGFSNAFFRSLSQNGVNRAYVNPNSGGQATYSELSFSLGAGDRLQVGTIQVDPITDSDVFLHGVIREYNAINYTEITT